MKKVVLSKMKCAALFAMMFFSYQGMAQRASLYIGDNCKFYPTYKNWYNMMVAHLVTDEHNPSAKYLMADKILFIEREETAKIKTKTVTSEYGNFIEFYDVENDSFKIFCDGYLIAKNGSSLYLLYDYKCTLIGTITTDLEIADDFQIIYTHPYLNDEGVGSIYIKNNGILSRYTLNDIKNNTSINSPKVDEKEDATYSIDGKKVQTPHNGIFIKGDKKVMIK